MSRANSSRGLFGSLEAGDELLLSLASETKDTHVILSIIRFTAMAEGDCRIISGPHHLADLF